MWYSVTGGWYGKRKTVTGSRSTYVDKERTLNWRERTFQQHVQGWSPGIQPRWHQTSKGSKALVVRFHCRHETGATLAFSGAYRVTSKPVGALESAG